MRQARHKRMEMVIEKGKGRFLAVGFLPVVPRRLDFASADWKIIQDPEMFDHISCTPATCVTLDFGLFPNFCHLKYSSGDSKTAKRFAHVTAEFFGGF